MGAGTVCGSLGAAPPAVAVMTADEDLRDAQQIALERYLLETMTVSAEQLAVARKVQARQQGPLLAILLQLSFIDIDTFARLLDWSGTPQRS